MDRQANYRRLGPCRCNLIDMVEANKDFSSLAATMGYNAGRQLASRTRSDGHMFRTNDSEEENGHSGEDMDGEEKEAGLFGTRCECGMQLGSQTQLSSGTCSASTG